jgi:hypothetical protein
MAKRSRTAVRPGQRRPIQRRPAGQGPSSGSAAPGSGTDRPAAGTTPAAPRPSGGLTPAEAARAEQLEAQIRAEERALESARKASRDRARERVEVTPGSSSLAAASHEYDYVARDIRRIAVVAALLLGVLFLIWILVEVVGVIRIA